MSFIKDLCKGKQNDVTKLRFARFGKGNFEKEETKIRMMSTGMKVYSGFLFINDVVRIFADRAEGEISVEGAIVSKDLDIEKLKDYSFELNKIRGKTPGRKVNGSITGEKLNDLVDDFEDSFLLLQLKDEKGFYVKTSNKKPPKISKKKEKFVKAKLPKDVKDKVIDEFFFDLDKEIDKKAKVRELYQIDDIEIPKDVKDFAKARIQAKRIGKIIRKFEIDGEKIVKEYPLKY